MIEVLVILNVQEQCSATLKERRLYEFGSWMADGYSAERLQVKLKRSGGKISEYGP